MKLKSKDKKTINRKINGQIHLEMRKKAPRYSISKDKKKEASRSACRGKASFYFSFVY